MPERGRRGAYEIRVSCFSVGKRILLPIRKQSIRKEINMQIQVLGPGCANCKRLYEMVSQLVNELNLDAKVEYITDVTKIIELGIMTSPVLVVDKKSVMTGFTPNRELVREKILEVINK